MVLACRIRRFRLASLVTCVCAGALLWGFSRDDAVTLRSERPKQRRLSRDITVIFRQVYENDYQLIDSAVLWSSNLGAVPVFIFVDHTLYPHSLFTDYRNMSIRFISMELSLSASPDDLNPLSYVKTEFVLFAPDATRPPPKRLMRKALKKAVSLPNNTALVLQSAKDQIVCLNAHYSYRDWTLRYSLSKSPLLCDAVHGRHALLIRATTLRQLPRPMMLPYPESLYLQTSIRHVKLHIFSEARLVVTRPPAPWHRRRDPKLEREWRTTLYRQIGVKRVVKENGDEVSYGCTRTTERCFPPTTGTPPYLPAGRNTPPCCLRHAHRVVRHALRVLQSAGARCWLEATTLLGAVTGGALPGWADRGEIGVHADDVNRSWLVRAAATARTVDADGYVWERATGGRYYRVAYSAANRIFVDILPFQPYNGTMTRSWWYIEHQKDFPEHFLHPMSTVQFAGITAPVPNNVRDFLQVKFGDNVMENYERVGYRLQWPFNGTTIR